MCLGVEFGKRKGSKEMKSGGLSKVEGRIRKVDVLKRMAGDQANAYWREGNVRWRLGQRLMSVRRNTKYQEVIQCGGGTELSRVCGEIVEGKNVLASGAQVADWSKEIMADIDREEKEWKARVEAKPKLRSYKLIKVKLELEEYLEVR